VDVAVLHTAAVLQRDKTAAEKSGGADATLEIVGLATAEREVVGGFAGGEVRSGAAVVGRHNDDGVVVELVQYSG